MATYKEQIEGLYTNVLGRSADAPGLAYWIKDLESGRSIGDIEKDIKASPEYTLTDGKPTEGQLDLHLQRHYGNDSWQQYDDEVNPVAKSTSTQTGNSQPASNPGSSNPAWVEKNQSVASNVDEILAKDSPLMTRAATRGLQTANRRGLLNSSMAVEAAQAAVLDAATPIASQDAAQNAAQNLSRQGFMQNKELQDSQLANQRWLAELDTNSREYIANLDATVRRDIANMQLSATDREKAASVITSMQNIYSSVFQALATNADIPRESRDLYLEHISAMLTQNIRTVEQLYNIKLEWTPPSSPTNGSNNNPSTDTN